MEKRTLIFILLSVLIWLIWWSIFAKPPQKVPPSKRTTTAEKQELSPPVEPAEEEPFPPSMQSPAEKEFTHSPVSLEKKDIQTDYFKATFSNKGACLESLTLKKYLAYDKKGLLKLLNTFEENKLSLTLQDATGKEDLENTNWVLKSEGRTGEKITFRYTTREGLVIQKTYDFQQYNYAIKFRITFENTSNQSINSQFLITGAAGISPETTDRYYLNGIRAYQDDKGNWSVKNEVSIKNLQKKEAKGKTHTLTRGEDKVVWTGVANKYFAAVLIPSSSYTEDSIARYDYTLLTDTALLNRLREPGETRENISPEEIKARARNNINFNLTTKEFSLKPGGIKDFEFIFYAGPKKTEELAVLSNWGLDRLLSYGIFSFVSKILLLILVFFYGIFKNYGIAIITLTLLIKLVLFPLTKKGQVSAHKMQQLQPKIKALQLRYKNDKQRLGVEQLKLWREHGVNPLSGCLPMIFQIPVFIGLYMGLNLAIELRQSPFMLWISDLSQPDRLCPLPFPILGATYLHVLPLLMTASWIIQSLTQAKSPDPQARSQQKLFTFMPLIFLFILYNFPSGLALYWFMSTLFGIIEQQIIKKVYFR